MLIVAFASRAARTKFSIASFFVELSSLDYLSKKMKPGLISYISISVNFNGMF